MEDEGLLLYHTSQRCFFDHNATAANRDYKEGMQK